MPLPRVSCAESALRREDIPVDRQGDRVVQEGGGQHRIAGHVERPGIDESLLPETAMFASVVRGFHPAEGCIGQGEVVNPDKLLTILPEFLLRRSH